MIHESRTWIVIFDRLGIKPRSGKTYIHKGGRCMKDWPEVALIRVELTPLPACLWPQFWNDLLGIRPTTPVRAWKAVCLLFSWQRSILVCLPYKEDQLIHISFICIFSACLAHFKCFSLTISIYQNLNNTQRIHYNDIVFKIVLNLWLVMAVDVGRFTYITAAEFSICYFSLHNLKGNEARLLSQQFFSSCWMMKNIDSQSESISL